MKTLVSFLLSLICLKNFAQVNLQTGSATFSLPMFNWQDDKSRLNAIIALNYNSGNGLKVNDVASNVGQGWNLLAGGVITRIQAGEPDDQQPNDGNGTIEDVSKYPPGYLYDPVSASMGCPGALIKYPIFLDQNHIYKQHNLVAADKEMDHFAFQFNGRSGVFILNKNSGLNNDGDIGISLGDTKMKIWFYRDVTMISQHIRTTITAFFIQDENGLVYKFTQHDITKSLRTQYCDKNFNKITQPKFKDNKVYHESSFDDGTILNPYIINGWYLTEIKDTLTNRKINFFYGTRNINSDAGISIANYYSDNSGIFGGEKNYSVVSHLKSVTQSPEIDSIIFQDGHKVTFNYGSNRIDLNADKILSSVDILYRGRYLSRYQFSTSYFILNRYGTPVTDYEKRCARLCLRSVKKIGVDLKGDDPPYTFDYYLGSSIEDDIVPPPFFHLKDIWGYYNGDNSENYDRETVHTYESIWDLDNKDLKGLCFTRYQGNSGDIYNAKSGYAKNGLLKQITYPAGGSLNYEYEQNIGTPDNQHQNILVGGVHASRTTLTDGGYSNPCNNPVATSYNYTLANATSSMWGLEQPVNTNTIYNNYKPEYKYFYYRPIFDMGCDYRYKYPGILFSEQAVNMSAFMQIFQTLMKIYSIYSQVKDIFQLISSGDPVTIIIEIVVEIGITCIGDHHLDNTTTVFYNSDLKSANPLPSQFKRVEVSENNGSNGKTVYDFTSPDDYDIWENTNPQYSAKQRYAYWAYGLPKLVTVYDATGYPVKQTDNRYDWMYAQMGIGYGKEFYTNYGSHPSCKCLVTASSSQKSDYWSDQAQYDAPTTAYVTTKTPGDPLQADIYPFYSGRVELDTVYERVFKPASQTEYLETMTLYQYSGNNYQVTNIKTTKSNGDQTFKDIKYTADGYGNILLKQNNILNVPIQVVEGIIKGNSLQYIGGKTTEYATLTNGDVKPSRILEARYSQPSTSFPIPSIEIQSFIYDDNGNLIGMKDEGGHIISNIYDYYDKYVSASVVNADPNIDKPAYTSFETDNNYGGWNLTGAAVTNNTASITGMRSFALTTSGFFSNHFSANLNSLKPYKISCWTSATISISGSATLAKSGPVINGFTYYEYDIPQGTASVTISGNALIDELRLYPQTSRMRTVTYDPLIGKTSECDENNRLTYYEYDNNSRLRFIKDENKNIVKMYEYNIAKKPTGCPATYFNLKVSEVFIKNTCGSGYIGDTVMYTIPESTYTSTISQDAVDQLVQNALNTLGQDYANSHGLCKQLFSNTEISQTFTKQGCGVGYIGTSITYTVPAGRYTSIISQADADEQAQDDMEGNAQALVNLPGSASCIISYTADWIGTGLENCQNGNKYKQVVDQNPNSSTYNQTQWVNTGADSTCSGICIGEGYALINGNCELGTKVYMGSVYQNNEWYCLYHYEFSDGSWSQDYVDYNTGSINQQFCLQQSY